MTVLIFGLCLMTAALCAVLLLRSYVRTRFALLLWSGLCFVGLTANNVLLLLDKTVFPDLDLSPWRAALGLVSMLLLVVGLVMEREQ
ncbi:DUF5985 family protein [Roseateles sp. P5_E1]